MDPAGGCLGWAGPHRRPSLGWLRPRPVALLAGLADGEIQPKVALVGWP